ncbi:M48 family metalloprotease [Massilia sp. B-10]|nr:M48 family metalloprotease [Massilia sp. B-10]
MVAVVQLIIWSIRSLVESLFNAVSLMQRALSREMEMQADLVAVSLTGSDALIHALHRLQGADDAWDRALGFIHAEKDSGRATRDAFAVQTHMLQRMSAILNDDAYANVPPLFYRRAGAPPRVQGRTGPAAAHVAHPSAQSRARGERQEDLCA